MQEILIQHTPIERSEVVSLLGNPKHGGQAFFFGSVREHNHGRAVTSVAYDCFEPLAVKELENIATEARTRWGKDLEIVVRHAKGELKVGGVSVGIGVTSRHRAEAFEACRYIIEELKSRVPIWKKEIYEDGETEWLKGHALCQESHAESDRRVISGRKVESDGHVQGVPQG